MVEFIVTVMNVFSQRLYMHISLHGKSQADGLGSDNMEMLSLAMSLGKD